jgi:microcystin-dependent protein
MLVKAFLLSSFLESAASLIGEIIPFPIERVPDGFLECYGQAVSRSAYPDLFSVIGVRYGLGDGITTFHVPDLRGQFIRGWDHSAGVDPDAMNRDNRGDGTAGDFVGTKQSDSYKAHQHMLQDNLGFPYLALNDANLGSQRGSDAVGSHGPHEQGADSGVDHTTFSGGLETRPKNMNMMYIIRAVPTSNTEILQLQQTVGSLSQTVEQSETDIAQLQQTVDALSQTVGQLSNQGTFTTSSSIPEGMVAFFSSNQCPDGWELDSSLAGRTIVGTGNYIGSAEDTRTEARIYSLGDTGGEIHHATTIQEMPAHDHSRNPDELPEHINMGSPYGLPGSFTTGGGYLDYARTGDTGSNEPHNNMPPYVALTPCRKVGDEYLLSDNILDGYETNLQSSSAAETNLHVGMSEEVTASLIGGGMALVTSLLVVFLERKHCRPNPQDNLNHP